MTEKLLTTKLDNFNKGSVCKDQNGELLNLYHGSFNKIPNKYKSLTHFGSLNAALERLNHLGNNDKNYDKNQDKNGYVHQVYLNIQKPFILRDKGFQHTPEQILNDLGYSYDFFEQVYDEFGIEDFELDEQINSMCDKRNLSFQTIANFFKQFNYDGFKYVNNVEDTSSTSWCIFNWTQVYSLKVFENQLNLNSDLTDRSNSFKF